MRFARGVPEEHDKDFKVDYANFRLSVYKDLACSLSARAGEILLRGVLACSNRTREHQRGNPIHPGGPRLTLGALPVSCGCIALTDHSSADESWS